MKIYLACPYSHSNPKVRKRRFEIANREAAHFIEKGHIVFSPISHSHSIAKYIGNPNDSDFWTKQDLEFIKWCDKVMVICLEDWEDSEGIKKEVLEAKRIGKLVKYIEVDE